MRRREIDWIRNIIVLSLFIYHSSAIFCDFGDFYIKSKSSNLFSNIFILLTFSWIMPLLFFLAGASTFFALEKRNGWQYIRERVSRLLIPFLFGIVVIVPPQTYLARLWRGEKNINYFIHLKEFFTKKTDFMGFDGRFTPAHLWFIAFLFAISLVGVLIIKLSETKVGKNISKIIKCMLFGPYGIFIVLASVIVLEIMPSIGGKDIFNSLLMFILGYITYSDKQYIDKLSYHRIKFLLSNIIILIVGVVYFFGVRDLILLEVAYYVDSIIKSTMTLVMCLTILGYSIEYLNNDHKILKYLNKATFPVYLMHQTIILVLAFYILPLMLPVWLSLILIITSSFVLTFIAYEICKRIKPLEILLGIK